MLPNIGGISQSIRDNDRGFWTLLTWQNGILIYKRDILWWILLGMLTHDFAIPPTWFICNKHGLFLGTCHWRVSVSPQEFLTRFQDQLLSLLVRASREASRLGCAKFEPQALTAVTARLGRRDGEMGWGWWIWVSCRFSHVWTNINQSINGWWWWWWWWCRLL